METTGDLTLSQFLIEILFIYLDDILIYSLDLVSYQGHHKQVLGLAEIMASPSI